MIDYSYQLYSSRNFPPWSDTFSALAKLGYTQVEGFGAVYDNVAATKSLLDDNGLTMPTAHVSLQMLEDERAQVLELASTLDIKALYCPFLPHDQRPTTAEGYVAFGKRLQSVGKAYVDAGLIFGWHNHDFEFQALSDGSTPMQRIFEGAPDLSWEADIAWIVRGGADPFDWIKREGGRVTAVHIKDIAPDGECEDEDGWADVGQGVVDWKGLMAQLEMTSVEYYVMEHDNPSDAHRFASRSLDFCKTL